MMQHLPVGCQLSSIPSSWYDDNYMRVIRALKLHPARPHPRRARL
jgi:hypothetical protein